ncbi:MAG TPA: cellulase family glycosylhydrolase [Solirubrobacteraceae bacterium]
MGAHGALAALSATCAALALGALATVADSPAIASTVASSRLEATTGPRCDRLMRYEASDPLHVAGNRVVDAHGRQYVPDGISVYGGLEQWNGLDPGVEQRVHAQIVAATRIWHVNTIRLQIAEGLYFQHPGPFLQELDREVHLITCEGAIAVINDNTLFTTNQPNPTRASVTFMEVLASRYKDLSNVIFDVFNEPRIEIAHENRSLDSRAVWNLWKAGGNVDGVQYVGMQELVDAIRREQANNLVWVEGPRQASSLGRAERYPITGANVELSFHHPKLDQPSTWTELLRPTGHPRVEGEESQYSSPTRPECYDSAYTELPKLLAALAKYHDGLVAWSLEPGVLIASRAARHVTDTILPSDPASAAGLGRPSRLSPAYGCATKRPTQGMGELAMQFFRRYAAEDNPYAVFGHRHPHVPSGTP